MSIIGRNYCRSPRRGQWQLTQMIRVGCVLGRIAIRPYGGRKLPKEIALRRKQYEYYREKLLSFPKK